MHECANTIVITGAGSGFGEALAYRFSAAGYRVAVTDLHGDRCERVLREVVARGGEGFALAMDVTEEAAWNRLSERVMAEWGGLGVLVNNAGVAAAGRLEDTPLEDWRWILDTDLFSVVLGCHRFLPLLRSQGFGHVVNVASFAGMTPVPEVAAYATAKAAVVALSEQLLVDLHGSGVGVSVVCPAYVQTRLLETFRSGDDRHRKMAERWMAGSPVTAERVAQDVFDAVRKDRFLVLTHRETRWLWRLRRWFPNRYQRWVSKAAVRMQARRRS